MRSASGPARRARAAPSLQQSLLALVAVPVIGLAGAAGIAANEAGEIAAAAQRAAGEVRAAVALDAVRASTAQEVVPVLAQAVLSDPATATSVGIDLSGVPAGAGEAIQQQLREVQAATDAAVRTAVQVSAGTTAGTTATAQARAAGHRIAQLRAAAATGQDITAVFEDYRALVTELTGQVDAHLDAARAQSLDGAGARAVGDLDRAQQASTAASSQVPLLFGSLSASPAQRQEARASFLQAWGGYRAADAELLAHASAPTRRVWQRATSQGAAVQVDAVLDAAATSGAALSLAQFAALTGANTSRDAALRQAVHDIGERAVRATAGPARRAEQDLRALLTAGGVLLALTAAVMAGVHRFIARPLRRLATQAEAVRDGELLQIPQAGPREVRTVARGLAATVAGLRRVREQAGAVAAGDIDSDIVREPLPGPLGAVVHSSITQMVDALHERERLQAHLAHQASHDALTGLPNRAQALVLIEAALHRSRRARHDIGVLFIDLDHFKAVNDSFGHAAGDELLRVVAGRMQALVRGGDAVCRLGGDEFVVLVEPAGGHLELIELGKRLIEALCAPVHLDAQAGGRSARVGASIGITLSRSHESSQSQESSQSPEPGQARRDAGTSTVEVSAERLLGEADAAAYRAKHAGRGVVEVFDERLRQELSAQAATEAALRRALAGGELVLHYQPVLDLLTGATRSLEALVRWKRPGHGLVPPDEFIPTAERSDLVCEIGRWALHQATAQLATWDAAGGEHAGLGVAVNVSGRHLGARYLLEDVTDALTSSGIAAQRLTLEITETVLVDQPTALEQMAALRALGVRIAIDDFGTGYTSIGQLPHLPVDVLKIDRSFVSSPERGHADLVRLLITAAHSFALDVVAEGVEQDGQLQALLDSSCDSAQGFYFARPVAAGDLSIPRAHFSST